MRQITCGIKKSPSFDYSVGSGQLFVRARGCVLYWKLQNVCGIVLVIRIIMFATDIFLGLPLY
jgi:hypothetical protein